MWGLLNDIKSYWELICFAASIVVFVVIFVHNTNPKIFYKALYKSIFQIKEIENKNDKIRFNENYKKFKNYTPHTIRNIKDGRILPFKSFYKDINESSTKCVFVLGSSGIGKSTLMQQLARKFKGNKIKNKANGLLDYGIIYRQFNSQQTNEQGNFSGSILSLFEHIKSDLEHSNVSDVTILLDGFDETYDLLFDDAEKVFENLMGSVTHLLNHDLSSNKIKKIIISLRPEIFTKGIFQLDDFNSDKLIYEVNKLNKEQALKMYKNISGQNHESNAVRKANLVRLENIFDTSKDVDCVFSYPFIIEWAPDLLSEIKNDKQFNKKNMYSILNTIINKALEREHNTLNKVYSKKSQSTSIDNYINEGRLFIRSVALEMLKSNAVTNCKVNYDGLSEKSTDYTEKLLNTTRRLLRISESSLNDNGPSTYTFLHNMFYWFEVADILSDINTEITKEERINYLKSFSHTLVPSLYVQALYEKYSEHIGFPNDLPDSPTKLTHIDFNKKNNSSIFIDEFFQLLPYLQTITLNGIKFDKNETSNIITSGELDLSEQSENALMLLDCFSNEYIRILDVSDCNITSTTSLLEKADKLIGLQELWSFNNPIKLETICKELTFFKHKPALYYSITTREELDFLKYGVEIPFKEISFSLMNNNPFDSLYKVIYHKQQAGFSVSIYNPSAPKESDDCQDVELLEAIYELNKQKMISIIEKNLIEFLPIAKQYISILKAEDDYIQIKIETDFVNDIINHNGLTKYETWLNSDLYHSTEAPNIKDEYKTLKEKMDTILEKYIYNFVHISQLYVSALETLGDEKRINSVFNYVIDLIHKKHTSNVCAFKYDFQQSKMSCEKVCSLITIAAECQKIKNGLAEYLLANLYRYADTIERQLANLTIEKNNTYYKADLTKKPHLKVGSEYAFYWYKQSANSNFALGMNAVGWCYMEGYGVSSPDFKLAYEWYKKSADNNCGEGIFNLATCYSSGIGINTPDHQTAFDLYKKAAEKGEAAAMLALCLCYDKCIGIDSTNHELAKYWNRKYAENHCAYDEYCLATALLCEIDKLKTLNYHSSKHLI